MQETLVRHYHLDKGTIARAVKKLEAGGYIRRIVDPANRRAVRLFLTDKGEEVVPLLQAIDREWEDRICAGFSVDDRTTMSAFMRHVAQNSHLFMQNSGDISRAEE